MITAPEPQSPRRILENPSKIRKILETFKENAYEVSENDFLMSLTDRIIMELEYLYTYLPDPGIKKIIDELKLLECTLQGKKPELLKENFEIEQKIINLIEGSKFLKIRG